MSNDYLENTKMAAAHLGKVLVLGLGVSGKATARYCADLLGGRVDELYVAAGARNADSEAFVATLPAAVAVEFGDDAVGPLAEAAGGSFDICIASPGIPYWAPLYEQGQKASDELVSEVEFAWRESAEDSTWVAITGTNGKTTTTACCAAVLQAAGMAAAAVGNIGDTCITAVKGASTDVYVAEVSSYQLASTRYFAPDVAVLLNITPDHVHWHKTLEAYAQAKFNVLRNLDSARGVSPKLGGRRVAILDATNDVVRAKVRECKAIDEQARGFSYIPLGTKAGIFGDMRAACGALNAAFLDEDGHLHVAFDGTDHVLLAAEDLKIPGEHNIGNALMVAATAIVLGVADDVVSQALASFESLPHRIEPCGTVNGVRCYNDSKATNPDATIKALAAFPTTRPVVLLGGDDKGTDLAELVDTAYAHVRAAVCFGAGGPRFRDAFEQAADRAPQDFVLVSAGGLEDALDTALGIARAGDVLLLSPACASFDEFHSFEERGDVFKQLVAQRAEKAGR